MSKSRREDFERDFERADASGDPHAIDRAKAAHSAENEVTQATPPRARRGRIPKQTRRQR
ncbi:MAG: hypothetical protein M3P11_06980 [Actinomycetota bacterium]|nr:hypothetical protein [Actinomycetota bacterium]